MKMNINKAIEKIQDETVSYKETHPYYGLKDERGWLTRYPREDLVISREDMSVFLNAGGRLDSQGTWGANPYYGFGSLPAKKAAEFMLAAHCQRWDNVPGSWEWFTVSDSCTFRDYLKLCKGSQMKFELNKYSIATNASLFTLANKDYDWLYRKIAAEFSFDNQAHMKWAKYNYDVFTKLKPFGNKQFIKIAADHEKYEWRREIASAVRCKGRSTMKNDKMVSYSISTPDVYRNHGFFKSVGCINYKLRVFTTSQGVVAEGRKFLHLREKCGGTTSSKHRIKKFGVFSAAKINLRYFVWETKAGFVSHIEEIDFKYALSEVKRKVYGREEMEKLLSKGILTFRVFKKMTSSCIEGTKRWLMENAKHLHNLLSGFNSWEEVFTDEIADIKFQMTPEFIESIKFRF